MRAVMKDGASVWGGGSPVPLPGPVTLSHPPELGRALGLQGRAEADTPEGGQRSPSVLRDTFIPGLRVGPSSANGRHRRMLLGTGPLGHLLRLG